MNKEAIEAKVREFLATHPMNRQEDGEPYFEAPLFGYSSGADPLYDQYKTLIGPHHLTPAEAFASVRGRLPKSCTVVSWALPAAKATRADQRKEETYPARRWSRTRDFGQQFINELGRLMAEWLVGKGVEAAAPFLSPAFKMYQDPALGWASTWSERHAAYAGGLGTFSLNDGLITEKGIAHRLGSVVVELDLTPLARNPNYKGNCLYAVNGTCGACIKRCPAGALSEAGHDRDKCGKYCYETLGPLVAEKYGVGLNVTGCGLCQTKVPCEASIPKGLTD